MAASISGRGLYILGASHVISLHFHYFCGFASFRRVLFSSFLLSVLLETLRDGEVGIHARVGWRCRGACRMNTLHISM
jgi:hypothetical protein